jgi:hypothetical protein
MEFSYKVLVKLYHDNTLIYTEHFTEEDFYNNLVFYRCIEVPPHARVDTGHLELWYGIVHVRTLYTYRPGFFSVFFKCVMKLRRMGRKAQDTFRNTIQQVFHKHNIYGNYDIIQSILRHRLD